MVWGKGEKGREREGPYPHREAFLKGEMSSEHEDKQVVYDSDE